MKHIRSALIVGPAAALLLAACGGSSSLSHSQLVSRVTSACNLANASAARLAAPGAGYAGLATYAGGLSPVVGRLTDTLGALNANATERPTLDRFVSALRTGDRGLRLLAMASSEPQVTQASSLISSQSIPALADALGAPACGTSIGISR